MRTRRCCDGLAYVAGAFLLILVLLASPAQCKSIVVLITCIYAPNACKFHPFLSPYIYIIFVHVDGNQQKSLINCTRSCPTVRVRAWWCRRWAFSSLERQRLWADILPVDHVRATLGALLLLPGQQAGQVLRDHGWVQGQVPRLQPTLPAAVVQQQLCYYRLVFTRLRWQSRRRFRSKLNNQWPLMMKIHASILYCITCLSVV